MKKPSFKTFVIEILLRPQALRAFAVEAIKLTRWLIIFLAAFAVVRYFYGGEWTRADKWEVIGATIGLIAFWIVSVIRTISAAYCEFNGKRQPVATEAKR